MGIEPRSTQADLFFDMGMAAIVEAVAWWRRHPSVDRETMLDAMVDTFGRAIINFADADVTPG